MDSACTADYFQFSFFFSPRDAGLRSPDIFVSDQNLPYFNWRRAGFDSSLDKRSIVVNRLFNRHKFISFRRTGGREHRKKNKFLILSAAERQRGHIHRSRLIDAPSSRDVITLSFSYRNYSTAIRCLFYRLIISDFSLRRVTRGSFNRYEFYSSENNRTTFDIDK